jgi:dienelactone hydrolase
VLLHAAIPVSEFGGPRPQGLPLQIHMMEADELAVRDGDLDVARELADTIESAELFLYPGDRHLFADSSLPDYDESAATLVRRRVLDLLATIE